MTLRFAWSAALSSRQARVPECCSPECSLERKRQIKKRWKADNVERERECRQQRANGQPCPPVQKACAVCGRKFVLTESGGRSRKCCSAECSKKRERERQRQAYLADPGRIPRWRASYPERARANPGKTVRERDRAEAMFPPDDD